MIDLCLCTRLLVLTGKNCLSNIFMVNLHNRSNYNIPYHTSIHTYLCIIDVHIYIYIVHTANCGLLSSSFSKYRVQCILQSIQYSNMILFRIEQTHNGGVNFLTIFVYTNLHFVFVWNWIQPAGTLLFTERFSHWISWRKSVRYIIHGQGHAMPTCMPQYWYGPTLNIDMMMMADFFLFYGSLRDQKKKYKKRMKWMLDGRNRLALLSKFVWLHHCLDPEFMITHISRYLHCWCLLTSVVTTMHTDCVCVCDTV